MACGRLVGGRLVRSFGATHVLVYGSVLGGDRHARRRLRPAVAVALVGFALVGLGLANVFPLAIARAGLLGGSKGVALASTVGYTGLLGGPPLIGLIVGGVGLPSALATVSLLAAVAAGLSLYATPQRALLHARLADALDAGREQAVAGLTPAVLRYGPSVRRWADDLALLGGRGPGPWPATLTPIDGGLPALSATARPPVSPRVGTLPARVGTFAGASRHFRQRESDVPRTRAERRSGQRPTPAAGPLLALVCLADRQLLERAGLGRDGLTGGEARGRPIPRRPAWISLPPYSTEPGSGPSPGAISATVSGSSGRLCDWVIRSSPSV